MLNNIGITNIVIDFFSKDRPMSFSERLDSYLKELGVSAKELSLESGVSQVSGNMPIIMKQVFDTMSEATGVDFREIMKASTYDAKVNKNINVTGLENVNE